MNGGFEHLQGGSFKRACQQAGVVKLKICSTVHPVATHIHEVNVIRHELGELMAIMRCPSGYKGSRNLLDRCFISLSLWSGLTNDGEH